MNKDFINKKILALRLSAVPLLFLATPILNVQDLGLQQMSSLLEQSTYYPQTVAVVNTASSTETWSNSSQSAKPLQLGEEINLSNSASYGPFGQQQSPTPSDVEVAPLLEDQIATTSEQVVPEEQVLEPAVEEPIPTEELLPSDPVSFLQEHFFSLVKKVLSFVFLPAYAEDIDTVKKVSSPYLQFSEFIPVDREVKSIEKGTVQFKLKAPEEDALVNVYTTVDPTGSVWNLAYSSPISHKEESVVEFDLKEALSSIKNLKVRIEYVGVSPSEPFLVADLHLSLTFSTTLLQSPVNIPEPLQVPESPVFLISPEDITLSKNEIELNFPKDLGEALTITPFNTDIPTVSMKIIGASMESGLAQASSSLMYTGAFPATDLEYKTSDTELKEFIHLQDPSHPSSFRYNVNLDDFDVIQTDSNAINLYKKGKSGSSLYLLYTLTAPVMTDEEGNTSTDILLSYDQNIVTLTPSVEWLASATYPVIIDPTVAIQVLNVHSQPVAGEYWNVDYTTVGTSDLTITPADQVTVDDMEFTSLFCGAEDRTANVQILPGDVLFYPNWNCDDVATLSHLDLHTWSHHLVLEFGGVQSEAFNAAYVWDGGGGDALWSTDANWSSDIEPTSLDTATFDNTCVTNCNPTIDVDVSVAGLTMTSGYSGTIRMNDGTNLTVGSSDFSQAGGTFVGGTGTTTFSSADFTISGGTYYAATTTYYTHTGDNIGNHNININSSQSFYNLKFFATGQDSNVWIISSGDTLTVTNRVDFLAGAVNTGTLDVAGNITQESAATAGTAVLNFTDNAVPQTWTINGGTGPMLRLDSASDANDSVVFNAAGGLCGINVTGSFAGTIPFSNPSNYDISMGSCGWTQAAGTFNQGPVNMIVANFGGFNLSGGTFNGGVGTTSVYASDFTISGGTFNAATTTYFFHSGNNIGNHTININASQVFHNLAFYSAGQDSDTWTITSGDTLVTTGILNLVEGKIDTGTIDTRGDTMQYSTFDGGTAVIDFGNDAVSQTWTVNSSGSPAVRLDSASDASDTILLNAAPSFTGATTTSGFSGTLPFSNPSNYSYTIGSLGWKQAAGTFSMGTGNFSDSGVFTLTGGNFVGGIGTTTYNSSFTLSGGNYYTATGTAFAWAGGTTIDVNSSQDFYNVHFSYASCCATQPWTIASGDTLVAKGRTILGNTYLEGGTVEAQGDVIVQSGYNGGSSPLVFSGLAVQSFDLTGATGNFNADITVNKSGGEVDLSSALVMDAGSQDLTITSGIFNLNGNNLTVNGGSGTLPVQNGGTLKLQGGETVTLNSGYPVFSGSSTAEYTGSSSYTVKGWSYQNIYLSGVGSYSATSGPFTIGRDFIQSAGTFLASSGTTTVARNITHTGGTFSHNSGTVELNGSNQTINDSTTFNNLYKVVSSADTLSFEAGATTTVAGALTLRGAASNPLTLQSSSATNYWYIDPQSTRSVGYLDVSDSYNSNAARINAQNTSSNDGGNNVNWLFDPPFVLLDYRFYENVDLVTPTTSLGSESATTTIYSTSSPLRLRTNMTVEDYDLLSGNASFILQVATSSFNWLSVGSTTDWWNSSWQNRIKITFDNSSASVDLTDFPVLVSLTSSNVDFTKTRDSGQDIRFVDADGSTQLPYEIDNWNESATSTVWVKVPQIDAASTTDYIWMYYNNTSAVDASAPTQVWDSNFIGVWHMSDASGTVMDSTANDNDLNVQGGTPDYAQVGKIGKAINFTAASSEYLSKTGGTLTNLPTGNSQYYIEVWYNSNSSSNGNGLVGWGNYGSSNEANAFRRKTGADGYLNFWWANDFGVNQSISASSWYYAGAMFDGTNRAIFHNGGNIGSDTPVGHNMQNSNFRIASTNNGEYWDGLIDEVRISKASRSTSWIGAEYKNGYGDFNAFGSAQDVISNEWIFYNNGGVANNSTLSSLLLSTSDVAGAYSELNPTTANPNSVLVGQEVEWDFVLHPQNISESTDYYFRMLKSDGTTLDSYTYPVINLLLDSTDPTAGSIAVNATSATSLTATISGASDAGSGLGSSPYIVYNTTASTNSGTQSSSSWVSTSLTPNTSYTFYATVSDAAGNSADTAPASKYTLANPPSSVTATPDSTTQITLTWNTNSNSVGTEYFAMNTDTGITSGWITTTSFISSSLICGTTYDFEVVARNADNVITATSTASATTSSCPSSGGGGGGGGGSSGSSSGNSGNSNGNQSGNANGGASTSTPPIPPTSGGGSTTPPPPPPVNSPSLEVSLLVSSGGKTFSSTATGFTNLTSFEARVQSSGTANGRNKYEIDWNGDGIVDNTISSNAPQVTFNDGYIYSTSGTFQVKARVTRGGLVAEDTAEIVTTSPDISSTLQGSLTRSGWSNNIAVPLGRKVNFLFTVSPDLYKITKQKYVYTLDCNSDGTPERVYNNSTRSIYTAQNACTFLQNGVYIATLLTQSGGYSSIARMIVTAGTVVSPPTPPVVTPPTSTSTPPTSTTTPPIDPTSTEVPGSTPGEVTNDESIVDTITQDVVIPTVDTINQAAIAIGSYIAILGEGQPISQLFENVDTNTLLIMTAVAAPLAVTAHALINPGLITSFADGGSLLLSVVNQILPFFYLKKRRRYWGTVYDSDTKQPIDPAIVRLIDFNTNKVLEEAITDLYGRFGFLDKPGTFRITSEKTHYAFPSFKVFTSPDGIYDHIYRGEPIVINQSEAPSVISPNIPMDSLIEDWNQQAKQKYVKFHPVIDLILIYCTQTVLFSSLVLAVFILVTQFSLLALLSFSSSLAFVLIQTYLIPTRLWGRVKGVPKSVEACIILHPKGMPHTILGRAKVAVDGRYFLKATPGKFVLDLINKNTGELLHQRNVEVNRRGVVTEKIRV